MVKEGGEIFEVWIVKLWMIVLVRPICDIEKCEALELFDQFVIVVAIR